MWHADRFMYRIKKARKKKGESRIRAIAEGLKTMAYLHSSSFDGRLLSAVNKIVGLENYSMKARLSTPEDKESPFFARRDHVNAQGEYNADIAPFLVLKPMTPSEFYSMFDTLLM